MRIELDTCIWWLVTPPAAASCHHERKHSNNAKWRDQVCSVALHGSTVVWMCVGPGTCVVCVPVCDSVTVSHCPADNDKLLLFTVTLWPAVRYDSVYRWRPHSSRHQVLLFVLSVTHKMRFVCVPVCLGHIKICFPWVMLIKKSDSWLITDCSIWKDKASVCFHSIFWNVWPLNMSFFYVYESWPQWTEG